MSVGTGYDFAIDVVDGPAADRDARAEVVGGTEKAVEGRVDRGPADEVHALAVADGGAARADATDVDTGPADQSRAIAVRVGGTGDTRLLAAYAGTFRDVQQLRIATGQRGLAPAFGDALEALEARLAKAVRHELREHMLWPWLAQYPGLGGVQVATLLARIGDPARFPGQPCTLGHISAGGRPAGSPCPATSGEDEPCPGTMLERRPGTGVRPLWRYCGLHVVDGHGARRTRGERASWDPRARAALLMPKGIADQILMKSLEPWVSIYRSTKARKLDGPAGTTVALDMRTGGPVDSRNAVDRPSGGPDDGDGADIHSAIDDTTGPLPPIRAHAIARTVAAKAFLGDLLTAWKVAARV